MKGFKLFLMAVSALPLMVEAKANCQTSSSWQCQDRGQSNLGTYVQPQSVLPSQTAQPGSTTPALGSGTTDHNTITLRPIDSTVIEGFAPVPALIPAPKKSFTGTGVQPITVTPTQGQTFTGTSPVPQVQAMPTPSFTGMGVQPITVTPTQGQTFTGTSPVPQVQAMPTPSFTGTGGQPITVTPTQGQTFTGTSPVPQVQAMPTPSFTGTGGQPITVTPTQGQTFTGTSPVPQVQAMPTPSFTGTGVMPTQSVTSVAPKGKVKQLLPAYNANIPTSIPTGVQTTMGQGATVIPTQLPTTDVTTFGASQTGQTGVGTTTPSIGTSTVQTALLGGINKTQFLNKKKASHVLVVHQPPAVQPITSGNHSANEPYSLELIEPGIQNHKVEVYRTKDVKQLIYKDLSPLDTGGFHLQVMGLRNPEYSH